LNQAAIQSVPSHLAGDAAGLFSAARNIGGSFALAGIATVQDQRMWLHSRRLEESLPANSPRVTDYIAALGHGPMGSDAGMRMLGATIQREALVMTYNDMFWLLVVGIVLIGPLVLLLKPLPHGPVVMAH